MLCRVAPPRRENFPGDVFTAEVFEMKKALLALSIMGFAALSATAQADANKPVSLWLCSDYLTVNETVQPTALGFAAAVNHQGDVKDAVLNVEGIAKVQPEVLKYCKENPKVALRDALIQTAPIYKGTVK
jgi:acid stress chaperone HdeA